MDTADVAWITIGASTTSMGRARSHMLPVKGGQGRSSSDVLGYAAVVAVCGLVFLAVALGVWL